MTRPPAVPLNTATRSVIKSQQASNHGDQGRTSSDGSDESKTENVDENDENEKDNGDPKADQKDNGDPPEDQKAIAQTIAPTITPTSAPVTPLITPPTTTTTTTSTTPSTNPIQVQSTGTSSSSPTANAMGFQAVSSSDPEANQQIITLKFQLSEQRMGTMEMVVGQLQLLVNNLTTTINNQKTEINNQNATINNLNTTVNTLTTNCNNLYAMLLQMKDDAATSKINDQKGSGGNPVFFSHTDLIAGIQKALVQHLAPYVAWSNKVTSPEAIKVVRFVTFCEALKLYDDLKAGSTETSKKDFWDAVGRLMGVEDFQNVEIIREQCVFGVGGKTDIDFLGPALNILTRNPTEIFQFNASYDNFSQLVKWVRGVYECMCIFQKMKIADVVAGFREFVKSGTSVKEAPGRPDEGQSNIAVENIVREIVACSLVDRSESNKVFMHAGVTANHPDDLTIGDMELTLGNWQKLKDNLKHFKGNRIHNQSDIPIVRSGFVMLDSDGRSEALEIVNNCQKDEFFKAEFGKYKGKKADNKSSNGIKHDDKKDDKKGQGRNRFDRNGKKGGGRSNSPG